MFKFLILLILTFSACKQRNQKNPNEEKLDLGASAELNISQEEQKIANFLEKNKIYLLSDDSTEQEDSPLGLVAGSKALANDAWISGLSNLFGKQGKRFKKLDPNISTKQTRQAGIDHWKGVLKGDATVEAPSRTVPFEDMDVLRKAAIETGYEVPLVLPNNRGLIMRKKFNRINNSVDDASPANPVIGGGTTGENYALIWRKADGEMGVTKLDQFDLKTDAIVWDSRGPLQVKFDPAVGIGEKALPPQILTYIQKNLKKEDPKNFFNDQNTLPTERVSSLEASLRFEIDLMTESRRMAYNTLADKRELSKELKSALSEIASKPTPLGNKILTKKLTKNKITIIDPKTKNKITYDNIAQYIEEAMPAAELKEAMKRIKDIENLGADEFLESALIRMRKLIDEDIEIYREFSKIIADSKSRQLTGRSSDLWDDFYKFDPVSKIERALEEGNLGNLAEYFANPKIGSIIDFADITEVLKPKSLGKDITQVKATVDAIKTLKKYAPDKNRFDEQVDELVIQGAIRSNDSKSIDAALEFKYKSSNDLDLKAQEELRTLAVESLTDGYNESAFHLIKKINADNIEVGPILESAMRSQYLTRQAKLDLLNAYKNRVITTMEYEFILRKAIEDDSVDIIKELGEFNRLKSQTEIDEYLDFFDYNGNNPEITFSNNSDIKRQRLDVNLDYAMDNKSWEVVEYYMKNRDVTNPELFAALRRQESNDLLEEMKSKKLLTDQKLQEYNEWKRLKDEEADRAMFEMYK